MTINLAQQGRLHSLNSLLFGGCNSVDTRKEIELRISNTKKLLIDQMRSLEKLLLIPEIKTIDAAALAAFFTEHPAMEIVHETDFISLISSCQSVSFHTRRGTNRHAQNNDIIYVTLPLYSFRIDFYMDGKVSVKIGPANYFKRTQHGGLRYGHPHTSGSGSSFGSVCTGNNRFIAEWENLMNTGVLTGPVFLRLMSQAATWLESANLDDMYDNILVGGLSNPELPDIAADEALRYFLAPKLGDIPEEIVFWHDPRRDPDYARRCLYSFWVYRRFYDFGYGIQRRNSFYAAIKADLLAMLDPAFLLDINRYFVGAMKELERSTSIANRCYRELSGYCPTPDGLTLSETNPDIFIME